MIMLLMTMVSTHFVYAQSNVLPNGDFSDTSGVTGWTPVGTGSVKYVNTVDADNAPASGAMVLGYLDSNDPEHAVSQCFPVTAGTSYQFGGKYEEINAFEVVGGAQMTCSSFSDTNCASGEMSLGLASLSSATTTSFASWNSASGNLASNARAAQCTVSTVEIISGFPGITQGSGAYVDDLFFALRPSGGPVLLGGYLSGSWYDPMQAG